MAKKKEITTKKLRSCRECAFSKLMQYGRTNPVVAGCTAKKELVARQNGKVEYEHPVMVASTMHYCELFDQSKKEKSVELMERRAV